MNTPAGRPRHYLLIALCSATSLLPYAVAQADFRRLFWFGDEWHLLLQIEEVGFARWLMLGSAGNFWPLFKLLWGGAVYLFHGSYPAMIALCWLTHAFNVFLFGVLLDRCGFGRAAMALALLVLGLAFTNIEILAWSIEWGPLLSWSFVLVAALMIFQLGEQWSCLRLFALGLAVLCSGLTFPRGVVTGAALAALCLFPGGLHEIASRRRAILIAMTLLPSIAVAILSIVFGSTPPEFIPRDGAAWIVVGRFAAASYFLNPLVALISPALLHGAPAAALGICKVVVVIWALAAHRGRVRSLLLLLLLLDLGNSVLLAVGRWWTTPAMAISSRYQYGPLLFFFPSAGLLLEKLRERAGRYGPALAAGAVACAALAAGLRWPREIVGWANWRGTKTRDLLVHSDPARDGAPPNVPALWSSSAREITARFNLH